MAAEGAACNKDADCDRGLMCGTIQNAAGEKTSMCVPPDGVWNLSGMKAKSADRPLWMYAAIGVAFLLLLVMLRNAVVGREKRRKAAKPTAPPA